MTRLSYRTRQRSQGARLRASGNQLDYQPPVDHLRVGGKRDSHRSCLHDHPPPPGSPGEEAEPTPDKGVAARTRARHAEVHAALDRGLTITEISRALRLERKTVRRYATAATADQLIGGPRLSRPGLLGPHQTYLRQRWDEESATPTACTRSCASAATGAARAPCAGSPPSWARIPPSPLHHLRRKPGR